MSESEFGLGSVYACPVPMNASFNSGSKAADDQTETPNDPEGLT